jgi:MFS family permease
METAHDPYGALRYRDYRRVLSGSVLASIGSQMQAPVVGWELAERTAAAPVFGLIDPALAVGLVGLVQFVPVLLLSLPAGQIVDRHNRKGVIMAAQALFALAALGLATLSHLQGPVPLIYLCLLLTGIARAFSAPARWALMPMVVPGHLIGNAVTWNSSGWQIASVVGPALGGTVLAAVSPASAYVLAACCALSCALLVATTRPRAEARAHADRSLASLLAGARFVWRTKPILATITLDLFAVLLGGATALLPIFARDILQVGEVGYGWLYAAPALGALVMALALAHRPPLRRPGVGLLWAVTGFGVATIVFGLSENFVLSFVMLALTGALDNVSVVVRGTLVQVLTPDAMRGRVSAVNSVFIGSSNELGAFESGVTARWFDPVASVVGGGIGTILVVVAVMALWPEVLRLGPLDRPAAEPLTVGEDVGSGDGTSGWGGPDGARAVLDDTAPSRGRERPEDASPPAADVHGSADAP